MNRWYIRTCSLLAPTAVNAGSPDPVTPYFNARRGPPLPTRYTYPPSPPQTAG